MKILVTGSEGYFGSLLISHLIEKGYSEIVGVDRIQYSGAPGYRFIQQDLKVEQGVHDMLQKEKPDAVIHAAAMLAHERPDIKDLWASNVDATRYLANESIAVGVKRFIFISSNCLWGKEIDHPIEIDEPFDPVEIYGRSKMQSEIDLHELDKKLSIVIFRSPTIVSSGRLGLLGLLFELINENRRIPVLGDGLNKYQFVYGPDYAEAIVLALESEVTGIFHVGSNDVPTVKEMYESLIQHAESESKLLFLPEKLARYGLMFLSKLKLSPLGPYQYNMLGASFQFNLENTNSTLKWIPTKNNLEMFIEAYIGYISQLKRDTKGLSAHKRTARAPVFKIIKMIL
jgi:nucleoside-diphosphate-sugar epimerase